MYIRVSERILCNAMVNLYCESVILDIGKIHYLDGTINFETFSPNKMIGL